MTTIPQLAPTTKIGPTYDFIEGAAVVLNEIIDLGGDDLARTVCDRLDLAFDDFRMAGLDHVILEDLRKALAGFE